MEKRDEFALKSLLHNFFLLFTPMTSQEQRGINKKSSFLYLCLQYGGKEEKSHYEIPVIFFTFFFRPAASQGEELAETRMDVIRVMFKRKLHQA